MDIVEDVIGASWEGRREFVDTTCEETYSSRSRMKKVVEATAMRSACGRWFVVRLPDGATQTYPFDIIQHGAREANEILDNTELTQAEKDEKIRAIEQRAQSYMVKGTIAGGA